MSSVSLKLNKKILFLKLYLAKFSIVQHMKQTSIGVDTHTKIGHSYLYVMHKNEQQNIFKKMHLRQYSQRQGVSVSCYKKW